MFLSYQSFIDYLFFPLKSHNFFFKLFLLLFEVCSVFILLVNEIHLELSNLLIVLLLYFLQSFKILILRHRLVSALKCLLHSILPSLDLLLLLFRVVRINFILRLELVRFGIILPFPVLNLIGVEILEMHEDALSALFAVEDVFLEVGDSGVFGREELSLRVVRDPPKCVSQIIVCSDRVPELIESVSDEAEEEFPMLLVLE